MAVLTKTLVNELAANQSGIHDKVNAAIVAEIDSSITDIGLNAVATAAQGTSIADATNETDVITNLNLLLAFLRTRGDIASPA